MKQKTVRFLSFLSALCMVTAQSIPALAADSTQETNIASKQSAIVNYEQASAFSVTIPKAIVLNSNKNAAYNVKVKGDIAGNESVTVIPDATVTLNDANGKTPVTGTIDQVKTEFLCNEIATDDGCSTDGKITAEDLTSGDWSGVFKFEIGTNAGIGDEISLTSNNLTTYNIDTVGDVVIPGFVTDDDNTRHAVASISDYAFRNCTEMTGVTIADSVTRVGTGAFANCSKLSSVTIPNSVKSIGNSVFDGCTSLSVINYNGNEYDSSNIESALEANGITIGDNIFDHSYGQPVYEWSDNNTTCTATKTCSECDNTITETVDVSQQTTNATCTNEGLNTYTATFKNSDFETQTKTSKISAKGHKSVSANNAVAATCTTNGKESDTVCSVCGVTLATGKTITKTGHKYGTPTYTWSKDGKTCVAKRVCANDGTHIETENATITNKVKTAATCTAKGTRIYTATFKNTAFKTQTKDIQDIAALGHSYSSEYTIDTAATCTADGSKSQHCTRSGCTAKQNVTAITKTGHKYGNPTYTWSKDKSTCIAARTCSVCSNKQTETVNATSKVTKAATCTGASVKTYTAKFTNTAFATQTTTSSISAVGHKSVSANNAVAATCTTDGKESDTVCSVCGVTLATGKTITKTGHTPIDGYCTKCNERIAGFYDANGNLVANWDSIAIAVSRDYSSTNSSTDYTSPYSALKRCPKATKIVIKDGVTSIGGYAFASCSQIHSIDIPDSVTSIGNKAFYNCTSLDDVNIPNNVKLIYANTFGSCRALRTVVFKNTNGWYVGKTIGEKTKELASSDLSDSSKAASYLKNSYVSYYWSKK